VAGQLKQLGFEPGWGKNVGVVRKRLHELLDILEVCGEPCRVLLP
jgi:Sucrose synthase